MNRLLRALETLPARRAQVFFYLFALHIYYPVRKVYEQRYGSQWSAKYMSRQGQIAAKSPLISLIEASRSSIGQSARRHDSNGLMSRWIWRDLPPMWPGLHWYRLLNSIWMVSVVIKYSYPRVLTWPIEFLFGTERPECYLMGRFIINDDVGNLTAIFFALYHLAWRSVQLFANNPLMLGVLYFLILDERDIQSYYHLFSALEEDKLLANARPEASTSINNCRGVKRVEVETTSTDTDRREQFMHDVMSCHIVYRTGTFYKLRPNRTMEASKRLRRYLSAITMIGLTIFLSLSVIILLMSWNNIWSDKRYLKDYINCDLELKRLNDTGQLDSWSMHYTGHHMLAISVDLWENFILWSESGLAAFSVSFSLLLNEDLLIYWRYLDEKIKQTLNQVVERHHTNLMRIPQLKGFDDDQHDQLIYELQIEILDMIRQIERSDQIITDFSWMTITVWFSLFGFSTYSWRTHLENLPISLHLMLFAVLVGVTNMSYALLSLHRKCLKTYPNICSLMAYDSSRYKKNFVEIIDCYDRKRTCFTMCRCYPMTTTTYLTMIGYSFSFYFILGSMSRR